MKSVVLLSVCAEQLGFETPAWHCKAKKDNSGQGQCQAQGLLNFLSHCLMQICETKSSGLSEALHLYMKASFKCRSSVFKLIFNQTVHSAFLQLLQQISLLRKPGLGEHVFINFCLISSSQMYILLSSPHPTPRLLGNDGKRSWYRKTDSLMYSLGWEPNYSKH